MKGYYHECRDHLILRDYLALDRTHLANKRTLLAYCRTATGIFASGVGMIGLLTDSIFCYLGWILMCTAPLILIAGLIDYFRVRRRWAHINAPETATRPDIP